MSEDNVEYRREIIHVIEQSYKDPDSVNRLVHSKAFRVRNSHLLNEVSLTITLVFNLVEYRATNSSAFKSIFTMRCYAEHGYAVVSQYVIHLSAVCLQYWCNLII